MGYSKIYFDFRTGHLRTPLGKAPGEYFLYSLELSAIMNFKQDLTFWRDFNAHEIWAPNSRIPMNTSILKLTFATVVKSPVTPVGTTQLHKSATRLTCFAWSETVRIRVKSMCTTSRINFKYRPFATLSYNFVFLLRVFAGKIPYSAVCANIEEYQSVKISL